MPFLTTECKRLSRRRCPAAGGRDFSNCPVLFSSAETKRLILTKLEEQIDANMGAAMMYTLFEWAKENQEALMENHKPVAAAAALVSERLTAVMSRCGAGANWLCCFSFRICPPAAATRSRRRRQQRRTKRSS